MINLFVADGRLGNQLFQINAIRGFRQGHVWLAGYDQASHIMNKSVLRGLHFISGIVGRVLTSAVVRNGLRNSTSILGVFGIKVVSGKSADGRAHLDNIIIGKISRKTWPLMCIYTDFTMVSACSFQRQTDCHKDTYIKRSLLDQATEWFRIRGIDPRDCCFVHVRRGDYENWPSKEQNAILPDTWYLKGIEKVRERSRRNNLSILVSSDSEISLNDYGADFRIEEGYEKTFAILSLCRYGVLSPSTFSLSAALHGYIHKDEGIFIAPEKWGGHKGLEWYPERSKIEFSELVYV